MIKLPENNWISFPETRMITLHDGYEIVLVSPQYGCQQSWVQLLIHVLRYTLLPSFLFLVRQLMDAVHGLMFILEYRLRDMM